MATITMGLASTLVTATKTWTETEASMQDILNWGKDAFNAYIQATFNPSNNPTFVPTNQQIAAAIAHNWMTGVETAVQQHKTTPAVVAAADGVVMKFELSEQMVTVIAQVLQKAPYEMVAPILAELQRQINEQQNPAPPKNDPAVASLRKRQEN